jgi:cell division protein FtsI/penicillin-binding protein 2
VGLTFATKKQHRWLRPRTFVIAIVLVAAVVAGFFVLTRGSSGPPALPARDVDNFLHAWSNGDTSTMATFFDVPPADLATAATSLVQSAPGSRAQYTRTTLVRDQHGSGATATYRAKVDLAGFGPFEWDGTLALVRVKEGKNTVWRIASNPSDLYPGLAAGQHLTLQRVWPTRAAITASDGSLLAGPQSVVMIGLEPDRVAATLPQIKQMLHTLVGTDPAAIDAALHGPGVRPNYFVPVATVPDDARYTSVLRPQLAPIAGVFFQRTHGVLAPSDVGERQLVGTVGDITAERLHQLGAPYEVGDKVGLGGLQAAFETRLAGGPTGTVVVVGGGKPLRVVKRYPGRAGQGVIVTLNPQVQAAAEAALNGVHQPAALVAIDTTTGQIRAVVSRPANGFSRAIDGEYPPGSTFKVITSTALLEAGRTGATPAPCPSTLVVDGRPFKNFEGEASGALTLAQAFKISCNNAFIRLAGQLPAGALARAAGEYGFNARWSLPVATFGGSYPTPKDAAELAGSAIGQGRVVASPLQMASVAAAVASGRWRAPVLTSAPAVHAATAPPLPPAVVELLRTFMATVVQPGGTAGNAGLPPGVLGKTGTAEFGNANPPHTHAWFIGFRGNLAFAVIVEGGGVGGQVAAPLAAKFLNALPA